MAKNKPTTDEAAADANAAPAQPVAQKPSVGRVVHYHTNEQPLKGQPYPAIITHVHEDGSVNLSVTQDATYPLYPDSLNPVRVPLGPTPDPAGESGAAPAFWAWPPRV